MLMVQSAECYSFEENKLFFSMSFFFPAQELVYNKIMENTLLQCTVESSPISRLYIGPKRKTCEPLHVGLPSIGTDLRAVFSSFHLSNFPKFTISGLKVNNLSISCELNSPHQSGWEFFSSSYT